MTERRLSDPDVAAAVRAIQDQKGEDIRVLSLAGITSISDYFIVCSGRSTRQNQSIAEAVTEALAERRRDPYSLEGGGSGRWILLDYVNFVVNIFLPEVRDFYGLERLWNDAEVIEIDGDGPGPRRSPSRARKGRTT